MTFFRMPSETRYVQALYDFNTSEKNEICLKVGDIIRIVTQIDVNWLKGSLNGKVGNFPANFVKDVTLPAFTDEQTLFVAIRSFPAEETGDLGFQKGLLPVFLLVNFYSGFFVFL